MTNLVSQIVTVDHYYVQISVNVGVEVARSTAQDFAKEKDGEDITKILPVFDMDKQGPISRIAALLNQHFLTAINNESLQASLTHFHLYREKETKEDYFYRKEKETGTIPVTVYLYGPFQTVRSISKSILLEQYSPRLYEGGKEQTAKVTFQDRYV